MVAEAVHVASSALKPDQKCAVLKALLWLATQRDAGTAEASFKEHIAPRAAAIAGALMDMWLTADAIVADIHKQRVAVQHLIVIMAASTRQEQQELQEKQTCWEQLYAAEQEQLKGAWAKLEQQQTALAVQDRQLAEQQEQLKQQQAELQEQRQRQSDVQEALDLQQKQLAHLQQVVEAQRAELQQQELTGQCHELEPTPLQAAEIQQQAAEIQQHLGQQHCFWQQIMAVYVVCISVWMMYSMAFSMQQ